METKRIQPGKPLVIDAIRLSKRFGDRTALKDVSFDLAPGEVMGYVGPNGAGKTTTFRILSGMETAFDGDLFIRGLPMPSDRKRISACFGYMPQAVAFGGWRTAAETLRLMGRLSGMDEAILARRIPETLEKVGLSEEQDARVSTFSGGMQQRLGLAQAILHEPALLILDEPFSHLDPAGRVQLKILLTEMSRKETAVLFSSHILSDVEEIVHRMVVLHKGRVYFTGTPSGFKIRNTLSREVGITLSGCENALSIVKSVSGIEDSRIEAGNLLIIRIGNDHAMEAVTTKALERVIASGGLVRQVQPRAPSLEEIIANLDNRGSA